MNSKKIMGPMFQNQVRTHALHLIINHCIYVFGLLQEEILTHSNKRGDEERIIELILEQREKKIIIFKPCHQEERHRAIRKRESPDGIPSCLRSPEGILYFDIGQRRSPEGTSHIALNKRESPDGIPS
jgi:hypothetical protein